MKNLENEIFKDIVRDEIKKLEDEKNRIEKQLSAPKPQQLVMFELRPEQKDPFEEGIKKLKRRLEEIRHEKEHLVNVLNEIGKKTRKDYFLWEIDFAEVFAQRGGFDIVIGNPPYVRQEMIAFPLEREEDYDADKWRERKRLYKEKLAQSVKMHWVEYVKIDKKSDLYVYFYYHGLALLRPGGAFCFINSNSWLDVGYGAGLQEFLLKNMEPIYIIDNLAKRSFAESDVNTVIVLIKRPKEKIEDSPVKFVAFKKPFEEVLKSDILVQVENSKERLFTDDYRISCKSRKELLEEGVEIPEEGDLIKDPMSLPYVGNKWGGKYLRAPEIFFKILEKGKDKLVRLGDIAKVKAGIITGSNINFYKPIEYPVPNNFSAVFKSPKEVAKITLKKEDAVTMLKVKNVPFKIKTASLLWPDLRNDRHLTHINKDMLPFEHNFYGIEPSNDVLLTAAILNSTLTAFFFEVLTRTGLGGGAARLVKIDIIKFPVFNLERLPDKSKKDILSSFKNMANREIKSIFEEIGLPKPNRDYSNIDPADISLDKVLPDRRELDKVVFEALGLTDDEQLEVYRAVVELVKNRLVKARSV